MTVTLEQQRAADAWKQSQGRGREYVNLAKGLPALIMNSGLMQVMAFLHEKGNKSSQAHCKVMGEHLRAWLKGRFPGEIKKDDFETVMQALMKADPSVYQRITAEAYAWLRWVRQIAAAVNL